MAEIQLLDQNTINKIAAGEVVERPSAVVKELIENAIDAGTSAVTVEIKGGGIDFIRITDNGSGIEKDQIKIAFERHATSKIRSAQDLLSVSSLGFRGEALASISAVSQVELITKTKGALTGTRYVIDGGEEKSYEEIGCPEGTTFVIRNLFYNVPARRKFLKSAQTETSYINDLVERLAISNPQISFKFMSNNQLKLQTSGNGNLKDILYHIYGRDITSNLVPVKSQSDIISMDGFIAKPVVNRGNRNYLNYFINGRYIKSKILDKAIEEAYKPYMMQHRHPMTALQFTIDSQFIDVNVHPTKMEVRFTNEHAIYQEVYLRISDVLSGKNLIPEVSVGKEKTEKKKVTQQPVPEPFETRRKLSDTVELGKQKVEAAKLISQFEKIKIKQQSNEKLNEKINAKSDEILTETKTGQVKKENSEKIQEETVYGKGLSFAEKAKQALKQKDRSSVSDPSIKTDQKQTEKIPDEEKKEQKLKEQELKVQEVRPDQEKELSTDTIWDKGSFVQGELFSTEDEKKLLSKEARKQHKIIGQIFDTYWIIEYQDKMFLIDQHAAHEKVLYEKTMRSLEKKEMTSQMLQPPIILSLSMREEQALKQHKAELEKIGFEIEAFGGREFSVRAVPANLFGVAQVELLTELLDSLTEDVKIKNSDIILEKIASMSCKAAIKGNSKMSRLEAEALIDELMELENPYNCPHGRPVIVSMTKYEVEKKFKRIV